MDTQSRHLKEELVEKAYIKFAGKFQNWSNKYNIVRQTGKMLSDYALLSKISLKGKKILDIGCSEPDDEVYFADIVEEWHALDINEAVIQAAREVTSNTLSSHLFSKLKFILGDVTDLDARDEYYDVVIAFSTIDHIPSHEKRIKAINEMSRVLKRDGYMVITIPNRWDVRFSYHSRKLQKKGEAIYGYEYRFSDSKPFGFIF